MERDSSKQGLHDPLHLPPRYYRHVLVFRPLSQAVRQRIDKSAIPGIGISGEGTVDFAAAIPTSDAGSIAAPCFRGTGAQTAAVLHHLAKGWDASCASEPMAPSAAAGEPQPGAFSS